MAVRQAILDHMERTAHLLLFQHIRSSHTSVQSYIASSKMDKSGMWGTETEMLALAHMLQTDIYSYNTDDCQWHKYGIAEMKVMMSLVPQYTHTILTTILKLCGQSGVTGNLAPPSKRH